MSHASVIIEITTTALVRRNCGLTSLSSAGWLQNGAAVKVDNFMSDGKLFHSDGPAT